jgi:hypothetical protein
MKLEMSFFQKNKFYVVLQLDELKKFGCDIPSGTNQGKVCPVLVHHRK